MSSTADWLRPSMLPKLALCGQYRPDSNPGDAAARGTRLDELFRRRIAGENIPVGDLLAEDRAALQWAVDTARAYAAGAFIETTEDKLRVEALEMKGTADGLCESQGWSLDLKTGQVRNYREQQAHYALGFMEALFADEWTVHLLFCDQQEVVTLRYTREDAEAIVRDVIAKALDEEQPPTPNDYCAWCARRWECPARREVLGIVPVAGPAALALEDFDSDTLREFVLRAKVVEDFAEKGREILTARMAKGEAIPGCSMVSKRGTRKVRWAWVEKHWKEIGTEELGQIIGDISEAKLLAAVSRKMPGTKIPDDQVQEMPGSSYIRIGKPKAALVTSA